MRHVTATWRLVIDDAPSDGAWNMAVDRAIQLARQTGDVPPTLRLYRWERPTVTLGRFQDVAGIDRDECDRNGIDVVRRFTGGRGVLHDDELTYSVCAGVGDGIPRSTSASYGLLCSALAETYRILGVDAQLTSRPRGDSSSSACYLHSTRADLSLGLAKLSGSAQVWTADTVLQHGSFTRSRDVARESAVFRLGRDAAEKLASQTAVLTDVLEAPPTLEAIGEAACAGFARVLGISLVRGRITPEERSNARVLTGETAAQGVSRRGGATGSRCG
jgi:lipoyl(octanoyl) transferase